MLWWVQRHRRCKRANTPPTSIFSVTLRGFFWTLDNIFLTIYFWEFAFKFYAEAWMYFWNVSTGGSVRQRVKGRSKDKRRQGEKRERKSRI